MNSANPSEIPQRHRLVEVEVHQMMGIFVKEGRLVVGIIFAGALGHDRDRPFGPARIETGEVGGEVGHGDRELLHRLDVGHDEHRQPVAVADPGIGHSANLAHRFVELFEAGGEGAQFVGRIVGIDDEMGGAGLVPGGGGGRGGKRDKHRTSDQQLTHVDIPHQSRQLTNSQRNICNPSR